MNIDLLGRSWEDRLRQRAAQTKYYFFASSPFITVEGCELLRSTFSETFRRDGEVRLLSDLSPVNLLQASTEPAALQLLLNSVTNSSLRHLPRLHAKVYIFDSDYAVVTSANLTGGGLYRNFECGVGISDEAVVSRIREEIESYAQLGAEIGSQQLARYCELAQEVRQRFAEQMRSVTRLARIAFERSIQETEDELIRLRTRGGHVTPLFAETIVFLLRQNGPLPTSKLQPLIQEIHPDLCDDTVDRVIDGVHYGKKWKHWVRSAQQRLKDDNVISLVDGRWCLN